MCIRMMISLRKHTYDQIKATYVNSTIDLIMGKIVSDMNFNSV
jgi:hypothetical protein